MNIIKIAKEIFERGNKGEIIQLLIIILIFIIAITLIHNIFKDKY